MEPARLHFTLPPQNQLEEAGALSLQTFEKSVTDTTNQVSQAFTTVREAFFWGPAASEKDATHALTTLKDFVLNEELLKQAAHFPIQTAEKLLNSELELAIAKRTVTTIDATLLTNRDWMQERVQNPPPDNDNSPLLPLKPSSDPELAFRWPGYSYTWFKLRSYPQTGSHAVKMEQESAQLIASLKAQILALKTRITTMGVDDDCSAIAQELASCRRHIVQQQTVLQQLHGAIAPLPEDDLKPVLYRFSNNQAAHLELYLKSMVEILETVAGPIERSACKALTALKAFFDPTQAQRSAISLFYAGLHLHTLLGHEHTLSKSVDTITAIFKKAAFHFLTLTEAENALLDSALQKLPNTSPDALKTIIAKLATRSLFFTAKEVDQSLELLLYALRTDPLFAEMLQDKPFKTLVDEYEAVFKDLRNEEMLARAADIISMIFEADEGPRAPLVYAKAMQDSLELAALSPKLAESLFGRLEKVAQAKNYPLLDVLQRHPKVVKGLWNPQKERPSESVIFRIVTASLFSTDEEEQKIAQEYFEDYFKRYNYDTFSADTRTLLVINSADRIEKLGEAELTAFIKAPFELYVTQGKGAGKVCSVSEAIFSLIRAEQKHEDHPLSDRFSEVRGLGELERWHKSKSLSRASSKANRQFHAALTDEKRAQVQQALGNAEAARWEENMQLVALYAKTFQAAPGDP